MNTIRNLSFGVATYHIQDCICFTFHPTKGEYWATEHSWRMISSGVVHGFNHHPWRHPWLAHLNSSHHCFRPSVVSTNRESGRKYKGKLRQQRIVYTLMRTRVSFAGHTLYSIFFKRNILHIFSSLFQHIKKELHDLHLLIKHCKCMTAPSCTHLWQHFPVRLPRIKSFSRAANTHHKVSRIVFLLFLSLQIPLPL